MKIVIELEGTPGQQTEIKRVTTQGAEQQTNISSAVSTGSSAIDAGHARIPDGYASETSSVNTSQQLMGNTPGPVTGAIDAGSPRLQQDVVQQAVAMPDTGNMETFNTAANAYSGGSFVDSSHN